ncbi:hypothetical protein FRC11_005205 [Ceratobasidium sp. 423]|nr:hypothetical protein FRC11_005205 [Ceratobasidium sp. 423]
MMVLQSISELCCKREFKGLIERAERLTAGIFAAHFKFLKHVSFADFLSDERIGLSSWLVGRQWRGPDLYVRTEDPNRPRSRIMQEMVQEGNRWEPPLTLYPPLLFTVRYNKVFEDATAIPEAFYGTPNSLPYFSDATPESKLSLEVLGQRFKLRSQAVSLFDVQQSTQLVIGFAGTTAAKWSATIKPSPAEGVERSLNGALENLMQFLNIPSAPKSTGKVRKILLEFAFIASKIHPSTETAILGLAEVLKKFAEQDEWSEGIRTLVGNLVGMMENVQEVAKSVEIDSLKGIIENMVALFEDVSVFVSEHESRGTTAFKHRLAVGVLDQIKTLSDRYDKLKAEFVTGIGAETHQKIHALGLHEFLGRLQSASPSGHDCDRVCQDGTREDVIDRIMGWTQQLPTRRKSLLWIRGQAGIGKSSIAASVCERLNRTGMLATCFFCKRDDDNFRDPLRLINSLAYGLAARCPEYGRVVANAIRDNMELCNLHMDQRYEGLIRKPLQELWYLSVSPLIIVVDALDECGTPNSRQKLLGHLQDMSQLVPWLGLIVTSRPTPEILDFFSGVPESTTSPIDLQEFDASHDIRAFIERKLIDVAKRDNWPYKSIDRLCERAGGVFIWAAIAVRHILGAMGSTEGRLREILNNQKSPVSNDLDKLYADILSSGMGDREDDNKALVCQCLGAIVIASKHQPLSIPILSTLLEKPTSDLDTVVKNLGSVLYLDGQLGGAVRFYHPSFADYITDPLRSQDFHADLDQQNINFARGCLRIIQKETRFNIFECTDLRVVSIRGYPSICATVAYIGSATWLVPLPKQLQEEIRKMTTGPQLIFWLEILSLIDRLDTALIDLPRLIQWLRDALESSAEIIREIYRFISVFRDAIATSTPHLYVSALALCPEKSLVVKELGHFFPKRITIQQGGDEHWPRWLRAITHPTHVMSLAVDQTGRMLATGCYDGTIRLWDLEAGIPIGDPLSGHTESVTSLEFSPNGSRLVSGSVDASVRMWDIQATNLVEGFSINHSDVVTSVAFSGDGKRVISGSWDGTIQISDAETGEPIDPKRPFVVQHHKNPEKILSVASSPDDTQIAYSSESPEHKATVRDLGSGEEQSLIAHAGDITSIMFSRDGAYIITGSADMTVRLWQSKTGDLVGQPLVGHSGFVTAVAFSPDGNKIVSSCNDSVIRIFDSKTNQLIGSSLAGHSGAVTCVAFTPNGAQIISGSLDTTLRIWATETDGNSGTLPAPRFVSIVRSLTNTRPSPVVTPLVTGHVGEVSTVAFSPEGSSIVSGSSDRTARIWDAETGNPIREPLKHNYAVDCLAISPDSRHIDWIQH